MGAPAAAALYRVMAEQVLRATAPGAGYERVLCFDPPDAAGEIRDWLGGAERLMPQAPGDLGARMAAAFAEAFAGGASRVAIVGTDAPAVTRARVDEALRGLDAHPVVLGPARDGGYYLLALDRPRPELFERIPWSTPAVLEATLARAAAHHLRVLLLPAEGDVDTLDDVRAEWDALRPLLQRAGLEEVFSRALSRPRHGR